MKVILFSILNKFGYEVYPKYIIDRWREKERELNALKIEKGQGISLADED